jgi:hypothetical protein
MGEFLPISEVSLVIRRILYLPEDMPWDISSFQPHTDIPEHQETNYITPWNRILEI